MAVKTYKAGVKEYRETYWMPEYTPADTDLLACFKITPQPGVPREEAAAAVAAESSTGTWTTVWTDLLTDLDYYKGRAYRIEDGGAVLFSQVRGDIFTIMGLPLLELLAFLRTRGVVPE